MAIVVAKGAAALGAVLVAGIITLLVKNDSLNDSLNDLVKENLSRDKQILRSKQTQLTALQRKIATEEKEIEAFNVERTDEKTQLIVAVGATGDGKSTFCNRLYGDTSEEGDEGGCKVSFEGKSCTKKPFKVACQNTKISVVDTPGFFDTFGEDEKNCNKLCKYLKGCGGINSFVLVRKSADYRLDSSFQSMLLQYRIMFGDAFLERLIVIATWSDYNNKLFEKKNVAKTWSNGICNQFHLKDFEIPVIPMGIDNYKNAIAELVQTIPSDKYIFEKIESPIDKWKECEKKLKKDVCALKKTIRKMEK